MPVRAWRGIADTHSHASVMLGVARFVIQVRPSEKGAPVVKRKLSPIHPGEILLEEFLKPLGISQYRLAKEISVPSRRINEIVLGRRAVSPDTALRLSRYFGLSDRFWMNLQSRYDLEVEKDKLADRLEREVRVYAAAS